MSSPKHGYNKALEIVKRRQLRELRLSQWLQTHQKFINELFRKAEAAAALTLHSYEASIDTVPAYGEWDTHQASITVSLRQLAGLKDPILEQALNLFIGCEDITCNDYPNYLNRDYRFKYPVEGGTISVLISAYVAEENPTCRKILRERKTVSRVEEVYEMVCDGEIIEADPVNPKLEGPGPLTIEA